MKNHKIVLSLAVILVLGLIFGASLQKTFAQEKKVSFNSVVAFSTPGGFLGFFDRGDGTVYFYDDQMKECMFKYQLKKLGEPGIVLAVEGQQ